MNPSFRRLIPQSLDAILAWCVVVSASAAFVTIGGHPTGIGNDGRAVVLAVALIIATVATFPFPIHLRHNVKLYMATVPLFVMAAALWPVEAAGTAGFAWLIGELMARKHTGAYVSDMVIGSARYSGVILATSAVIHVGFLSTLPLRLAAGFVTYWVAEAVTLPLVVCRVNGEPPLQVSSFVREASLAEGSQYAIGFVGALLVGPYPWSIALLGVPAGLTYSAFKNSKETRETTSQMLESMADAVDLRDPTTGGHSRRVAEYSAQILTALNKAGEERALVVSAARVHDIGKIGLPDSVLLYEGKLTDEQMALMQTHPDAGAQLLRRYREFSRGIDIVRHHHERWDGAGYPSGLKGQTIPFGARIVAVADSFDAMTSDRPYRRGMPRSTARDILIAGRGTQWDAEVIDAFISVLETKLLAPGAGDEAQALSGKSVELAVA